jgi:hypothetical protein
MTNSSFNRLTRGRIDGLTNSLPNGTSPRLSWGLLLCLLLGHSATALAAELTNTPPAEVPVVQTDSLANAQQQLANYSDQQIGVMLQRWPQLDAAQRRDLLAEVRKRMRQATAVNASKETAKTRSSGPSLTLRIKRAQSAHSYGRQGVRPRSQAMTQGTTQRQGQPPRDVVIRTTVTQILPDGSRLTREETLVPRSLRKDLVQPQQPSVVAATPNAAAVQPPPQTQPQSQAKGTVRVIRAKVRFGAGFDRRSQSNAESAAQARRVSTAEVAAPEVVQGSRPEGN